MTRLSPDFVKKVFGLVHTHLAVLGFEKRKPGILTIKISDDVLGWIGLNKAIRGKEDFLSINPVIGLRNQKVERLIADLLGESYSDIIPPTLSTNVGYLMPLKKYQSYSFSKEGSNEAVAKELVEAVREYGVPFIRRNVDLPALIKSMQTDHIGISFMTDYRVPAAYFLLGQIDKASEIFKTRLSEMENRHDPAALRYKTFASNLKARFNSTDGDGHS